MKGESENFASNAQKEVIYRELAFCSKISLEYYRFIFSPLNMNSVNAMDGIADSEAIKVIRFEALIEQCLLPNTSPRILGENVTEMRYIIDQLPCGQALFKVRRILSKIAAINFQNIESHANNPLQQDHISIGKIFAALGRKIAMKYEEEWSQIQEEGEEVVATAQKVHSQTIAVSEAFSHSPASAE